MTRRRLRQKLEFASEDVAEVRVPTEAELRRFLETHADADVLTARASWIVALLFGLLHRFGFAGALRSVGLPEEDVPVALLFFDVGVEAGQLIYIAAVVTVLTLVRRLIAARRTGERGPWRANELIRTTVAYLIGPTAAFWAVQRVVAFWT